MLFGVTIQSNPNANAICIHAVEGRRQTDTKTEDYRFQRSQVENGGLWDLTGIISLFQELSALIILT
jgi:hypothetical protein